MLEKTEPLIIDEEGADEQKTPDPNVIHPRRSSWVPMFKRYRQLRDLGVLGMNERNHHYISRYNPRHLFPIVDNKLKTKELALESKLTTPALITVVDNQHDVSRFFPLLPLDTGFCIKPAKGSGGRGIMVIVSRDGDRFQKTNGEWVDADALKRHVSNILAGLFSLGGATDVAMIEDLLTPSKQFGDFSFQGVPDIRVIVFRGVPIMAMMRLACQSSQGKANLHQGAIGVGLSMHSGHALQAVQKNKLIYLHPDTNTELNTLRIPDWQTLLTLACRCHEISGLGYLGVDLVIDEMAGPTLLELNARPGLSIQIANGAGLLPRLHAVERLRKPEYMPIDERIRFIADHLQVN